jgi:hypothetical protein
LVSLSSTARRNNGASVGFVVKAQIATDAIASTDIMTVRGLPA